MLLACLAGCAGPTATAPLGPPVGEERLAGLRYDVLFQPEGLLTVEVRPVGAGTLSGRWRFPRATGDVEAVSSLEGGALRPLPVSGEGEVRVPAGCEALRYTYDLAGAVRRHGPRFKSGAGSEGGFLVAGAAYLLRPAWVAYALPVALRFRGGPVLLPWERDADGVARVGGRGLLRPGFHTFGVAPRRIELEGGAIELAVLPAEQRPALQELRAWIEQAGRELLTVLGRLPNRRLPVTLVPLPGSARASPFGQILWSDGPTVALYVGGSASRRALGRDWVAVHELLHTAHPRLEPGLTWLSEGLATYYQEIARWRSGRLEEREVWSHVLAGVAGGRAESGGRSLAELSRRMHELRCYRAVYWGGALFALELDLELRRVSGGKRTLDHVLAALLSQGGPVGLEAFSAQVDAQAGAPVAARVAEAHLEGPALERAEHLCERLGISAAPLRLKPRGERSALGP